MKNLILLITCLLGWQIASANTTSQDSLTVQKSYFYAAKEEIKNMLEGKQPLNYERAVFLMENAFYDNFISYDSFKKEIDYRLNYINAIANIFNKQCKQEFSPDWLESVKEKKEKYISALNNFAIYTYLTDTCNVLINVESKIYLYSHFPFKYANEDPMGSNRWKNTQVFNLLGSVDESGNCFALSSLFKIFSERLNTNANLCTAPGHIYIRHADDKGIYHNVELASGSFPGTGSVKTLTYTTDEALKNQISLRTLDLKQSIGLCLVYLAKGYQHKFNITHDEFMKDCADLALQYDPLNLNALLLKAEIAEMKLLKKGKTAQQLIADKSFIEYEQQITRLFNLGYREMPLEMKNIIIASAKKDMLPLLTTNHTPQPFKSIGETDTRYATLSSGLFDEMQTTKPIEQYGMTLFDTKKKKITDFANEEPLYNNYNFDPVVFAWSIDPLIKNHESPYAAFSNNPIVFIDPDGRDTTVYVNFSNSGLNEEDQNKAIKHMQKIYNDANLNLSVMKTNEKWDDVKNKLDETDQFIEFYSVADPSSLIGLSSFGSNTIVAGVTEYGGKRSRINADHIALSEGQSRQIADVSVHESLHGFLGRSIKKNIFNLFLIEDPAYLNNDHHINTEDNILNTSGSPDYYTVPNVDNYSPDQKEKLTQGTSKAIKNWIDDDLRFHYLFGKANERFLGNDSRSKIKVEK